MFMTEIRYLPSLGGNCILRMAIEDSPIDTEDIEFQSI